MDMQIEIGGKAHEIPDTGSLTFAEWRLIKKETGLTAAEFEIALKSIDQEAWFWLCLIGVQRGDDRPREEIEADVGSINFLEMFNLDEEEESRPSPVPIDEAKSKPATTPDEAGTSVSQLSSV